MITRARDLLFRRVGVPLYAPLHRRNLRRWQKETFALVDRMAAEARHRGRAPFILLGLHHTMGDVLMGSAVIRETRRAYPNAALAFATQRRYRSLLAHNPNLDHIIDCHCMGSLLALATHSAFDRSHMLVLHGHSCELCGAVYHDPYAPHVAQGIDVGRWFHHRRHLVDLMFERLGFGDADPAPEIYVPAEIEARMKARLRSAVPSRAACIIAMHTQTPHWPAKQWPAANFKALMARVTAELGAQVVVVGAERADDVPAGVIDFTGQTAMLETAALLREVDVFVGLDSGPSHLASAIGTPSVVLFGPTDPATCRPLGKKVRVLWHGCAEDGLFAKGLRPGTQANRDIARITVDEVMETIREMMPTDVGQPVTGAA